MSVVGILSWHSLLMWLLVWLLVWLLEWLLVWLLDETVTLNCV